MNDETQPTASVIVAKIQSILQTIVTAQLESYASRLSGATSELAGTIRDVGNDVAERRGSAATKNLTQTLANNTERIGDYLKTTDGPSLLADTQRYGREQPLLASGIATLVGFAAARLLKVSAIGAGRTAA